MLEIKLKKFNNSSYISNNKSSSVLIYLMHGLEVSKILTIYVEKLNKNKPFSKS